MNQETQHKMLLTVGEAAVRLGVGRSFLYRLVMTGEVPSLKLGRARRIPVTALEEFIRGGLQDACSRSKDGAYFQRAPIRRAEDKTDV